MLILDLIEACGSAELAVILNIIKRVLNIIQMVGPILGIIGLLLTFIKLMASPDDKKLKTSIRNWTISIVMLFLIPVIINLVMGLFDDSFQLSACWTAASKSYSTSESKYSDDDGKEKTNFFSGSISNNQSYSSSGTGASSSPAQATSNSISKRIFIGDSRTVGMRMAVASNDADTWSCLVSIGLKWMKETGFPAVANKVGRGSAVIILLGVNDLGNVSQYASYINNLYDQYSSKGAYFYFVSVNPTAGNYNSLNSNIDTFNTKIKSSLNSKIKYIDTNSYLKSVGFDTADGLHYDKATYNKIYDYILKSL